MRRLGLGLLLTAGLLACVMVAYDDGQAEDWRRLDVKAAGPQISSAMAWDAARKVFVLYGGRNHRWDPLQETWEWSPSA